MSPNPSSETTSSSSKEKHRPAGERGLAAAGPNEPQYPFPIRVMGRVEKGFGRGSKELGCPTANLPAEVGSHPGLERDGIYFGFAKLDGTEVKEMVMSLGYCPVYGNLKRSVEIHIIHDFDRDFYGEKLRVIILGYIRPEYNYTTKEDLIADIETDKLVAKKSVAREGYQAFAQDCFFG